MNISMVQLTIESLRLSSRTQELGMQRSVNQSFVKKITFL